MARRDEAAGTDPGVRGSLSASTRAVLVDGPMAFLSRWIQTPNVSGVRAVADWLPLLVRGRSEPTTYSSLSPLGATDAAPSPEAGVASGWTWSLDTLTVRARVAGQGFEDVDLALVLDDASTALGEHHRDAWRTWLRLSNLINLRVRSASVVTSSLSSSAPAAEQPADTGAVPSGWEALFDQASPAEQALLRALALQDVDRPTLGEEVLDGVALSVAWPRTRVAVDFAFDDLDRGDLLGAGWRLVPPVVDEILDELARSR